tara:strand:- start:262 stop:408 length:147 start_codon:yes stop_codon:yes gene_type:complete
MLLVPLVGRAPLAPLVVGLLVLEPLVEREDVPVTLPPDVRDPKTVAIS